ncbi:amidohydrolase [Sandaracinobacteroides hominis]|uniref:amidohydrolase n=1 Tax=Sandaracinobacteroides hominis TaxID=2780086 RepID=UPI0018F3168A|nr:amidohydrolase [Sandaracinobacteroides hominis]
MQFRTTTALAALLALGALAACAPADGTAAEGADLIIHGGPILTMEGDAPAYVEAVVVDDGKIVFAGTEAEAMQLKAGGTEVKDLGGKLMMPGFIDPHSHFIDSLSLADRVNVSAPPVGPASSPDEIVATLTAAAKARGLKPGELFVGYGYDENLMPAGTSLSRDLLDEAFPNNPVVVIHVSMHGAVLNSAAFSQFGYKDGMPTPPGGVILRKGDTQDLEGLVMEAAYLQAFSALPLPTPETEVAAAKAGQMLYAEAGITTAQEGATHAAQIAQLQRIAKAGGLYIDVIAYPFLTDIDKVLEANPAASWGSYRDHLKIGGCKITADGSPQGKTAWFTTPYLTGGPSGEKDWKGEPGLPVPAMLAATKKCYDNKLQVLIHGNGDAAIDFLLQAHEAAAPGDLSADRRTVCIHCQFVRPDQLQKLKAYNIIPALFTDHSFFFADTHILNRGLKQTSFISPMKSAIALGLRPTNHTDAFVVPIDQMMTVWTAVNRTSRKGVAIGPDERITPYQALQAITVNAAHQYREEDSKGSIRRGKRADLVVLSADPNKVAREDIKDIKVVETIKDGKTIFPAS